MIQFTKPENLNGAELIAELTAVGVAINEPPFIDGNGDFWLNIKVEDEAKAASIVATHNGTIIAPEPSIADKLASVGLSIEELKTALLS
jgi:hypothetical protein